VTNNENNTNNNNETHVKNMQSPVTTYTNQNEDNSKNEDQLLIEKNDKKRTFQTINNEAEGTQYIIEWKFQEKPYNILHIQVNDNVKFVWNYTRNVWQFRDKKCYDNGDFADEKQLASSDVNEYKWIAQKSGIYYFGCQIGNAVHAGNMKIEIHVHDNNTKNNNNESANKKRRL